MSEAAGDVRWFLRPFHGGGVRQSRFGLWQSPSAFTACVKVNPCNQHEAKLRTSPVTASPAGLAPQRLFRSRRWKEEQGVRAHARGPRPVIRFGREERPARPPPTAARRLAGLATMPCGVSEIGFAAIRTPLSPSVRRGKPRLLPRQVRGRKSGTPALGWSGRHAGQGIELRPPAPALRRGPAGEPLSHLRGAPIMSPARGRVIIRQHTQ
jgi:hypothetical protein